MIIGRWLGFAASIKSCVLAKTLDSYRVDAVTFRSLTFRLQVKFSLTTYLFEAFVL